MKIKLNVDSKDYTEKPSKYVGAIRNRLCSADSIREITPDNLINAIQRGRSFTPAAMTGTKGDTWQSQQVIVADIDNDKYLKDEAGNFVLDENKKKIKVCLPDPLTPDEALAVMREYGIDPYFMYYSFSNTADWPRYRVVIILDEPLTNLDDAKTFTARLAELFNSTRAAKVKAKEGEPDGEMCADTEMADAARLLYGGRADCVFYRSDKTTSAAALLRLPPVTATAAAEAPARDVKPAAERPQQPNLNRAMMALESKLHDDINTFDLAAYVMETTSSEPKRKGSKLFFVPCPICKTGGLTNGGSFNVTGHLWHCFSEHHKMQPKGGTIIDYLMGRDNLTTGEAMDKFKFEIMRYDRDEWRQAYFDSLKPAPTDDFTDLDAPTEATAAPLAGDGAPFSGTQPPAAQAATAPTQATTRPRDFTELYSKWTANLTNSPEAQAYLQRNGISLAIADLANVGYDPAWVNPDTIMSLRSSGSKWTPPTTPRLIIPATTAHYVALDIRPDLDDKARQFARQTVGEPAIMGEHWLYDGAEWVFVTVNALDALSIMEAGQPAIALNSTNNVDKLIDTLYSNPTDATLILCDSKDREEHNAIEKLRAELRRRNIAFVPTDINGTYKTPNDALIADRATFEQAIEKAIAEAAAKPDNTAAYLDNLMFAEIEQFKQAKDRKTGFANLDEKAGALYSGLYVLAAISSLGKTTLALQMADQIAAAGHDVLFFSMEQSRLEMVSKSLARLTAQADFANAVSSLSIRKGYKSPLLAEAVKQYRAQTGDRMSIIEGNFDCDIGKISDYIRRYQKRTGTPPIVFIDYLQVLQPAAEGKSKGSKKDEIDLAITELKRLSRELDLTIIVISSLNRANYLTPIAFESLKESGGIEYTADVVWGLQLACLDDDLFTQEKKITEKREKINAAKAENPRRIKFICLKNRYGISSYDCYFNYYPQYDLFIPTQTTGSSTAPRGYKGR